jgi:hypothetical protein
MQRALLREILALYRVSYGRQVVKLNSANFRDHLGKPLSLFGHV